MFLGLGLYSYTCIISIINILISKSCIFIFARNRRTAQILDSACNDIFKSKLSCEYLKYYLPIDILLINILVIFGYFSEVTFITLVNASFSIRYTNEIKIISGLGSIE